MLKQNTNQKEKQRDELTQIAKCCSVRDTGLAWFYYDKPEDRDETRGVKTEEPQ